MKQDIQSHISLLRDAMRSAGVEAVIIPQTDPHQSEYIASHWQVRRWLSGFTGSAGDLVVTLKAAFIWADSRYWLQSAMQLEGTGIEVMQDGKPETPTITRYLIDNLQKGDTVGIDGMLFSVDATEHLKKDLATHGIGLRVDFNPIDGIWTDRPELPKDEVFIHDVKYAGEEPSAKIEKILADVALQGADSTFISDLAEIAWTLNIRSSDVKCNPVVTSFLYLSPDHSTLFIDADKLTEQVRDHLDRYGIAVCRYTDVTSWLSSLPADERVLIAPAKCAGIIADILGNRAVAGTSPVAMLKAVKNDVQIEGFRNAMIRDGVALVKTYMAIEAKLAAGGKVTEIEADDLSTGFRKASPLYFDKSFGSASAYGPNGAIVHYEADEQSNATFAPGSLYLFDSGVNYLDGTTDITRTICLGDPTQQERADFTLVMKGHIALATAIFPEGTCGTQLDALARQFLWQHGLSYLHGTGHGVGHFLNVHEGPQSVRLNYVPAPLTPGMITSNEPGLYREGVHGIRCENLVLCVPALDTEFGHFYKFETLTLFPFDTRLFATEMMTEAELSWVNAYNERVCRELSPMLDADARAWLESKTQAI